MGNHLGYLDHVLVRLFFFLSLSGRHGITNENSISFGCTYIGGITPETYSTSVFRIPWGVQMLPALLLLVGMIFLPESPRWLARHDRWEECHSVLTLVHGKGNAESPIVMTEMQEIRDMCEFERQNKDVNYLELFKPSMINRTLIGLFTQIWSQLTGMNIMSMLPFSSYDIDQAS